MSAERESRLLLELAGDARAPIELPRSGVLSIGSDRERVDFVIEGQGVAPVHCAIGRVKGGGWALKDLGSEYGVMINGERVASRKLEAGDLILIGSRRLRVLDADAPTPAAAPSAPEIVEAAPSRSAERAERSLPQVKGYRVERLLGRGGMGEVYLAVQESLGRPVALKVLADKLAADADFVRRFQAEARAAAALNHPNVVTVHDVWEEQGRHLLAMEYMDRGNLETRLARGGKLPVKEALDVLSDASKALVYAELRGIVHRDIKPANLMQNTVGTTKLADLGLAMHLEAEATESDNKKIFGTPHFISPEQARGEKVDVRSDMYSLGATMYRLLSGRTPFEGATTRDILRGHFLDEPRPLAELAPEAPQALLVIVERLLRKKPDDRYPSASVLLQEVERVKSVALHGELAAQAVKVSTGRAGLWAGVAAAVVVVGAAAWWMQRDGDRGPGRTETGRNDPRSSGANRGEDGDSVAGGPRNTGASTTTTDPLATTNGSKPTERPPDDDTALKLREMEAENAYFKISSDLEPADRRDELRSLAERFAGTTTAGRARQEADQIEATLARERAAESRFETAVSSWIERARAALRSGDERLALADALRAVLALEVSPELAADTTFQARRRGFVSETVTKAIADCRAAIEKANEHERAGRFDEVGAVLRPWLVALDIPSMPPELGFDAVPELGDLIGLRGLIQKRIDGLAGAREKWLRAQTVGDASTLAERLRGMQGVEGAIERLDFEALERRLTELESALKTEDARAWCAGLRSDLARGKAALAALASEFDAGGWRRKSVPDPRARGRANRDAVGVSSEGLMLKTETGGELAPWSAFGARPTDLHQLFHQRLNREYTADEQRGIEALLRTAAVLQVVREIEDLFDPANPGVLSEEEVRAVRDAFEAASAWSAGGADPLAIARESQAASLLLDAIRDSSAGAWSRAVVRFEELLSRFGDTLLVRLLSNGRGLVETAAPQER